jgi:hypothetical protein
MFLAQRHRTAPETDGRSGARRSHARVLGTDSTPRGSGLYAGYPVHSGRSNKARKPGAAIIARGPKQEDGSIDAAFLLVGKDGLVPPT